MCIDKDINYTNKKQILQLFDFYEEELYTNTDENRKLMKDILNVEKLFYENLTAYENLKIIAKLRGDYNPVNINSVLKIVNLDCEKSKKFKDFSLGMKQRLGIAAAIMHSPELLILDEPIKRLGHCLKDCPMNLE